MAFDATVWWIIEIVFLSVTMPPIAWKFRARIKELYRQKEAFFCLCIIGVYGIGMLFIYNLLTYFSSKAMLDFYQKVKDGDPDSNCLNHMNDIILNLITPLTEDDWSLVVGDGIPVFYIGVFVCVSLAACHLDILNSHIVILSITLVLNLIAEHATALAPSVGFQRCIDRYGVERAEDFKFAIGATGTCAGLMWSGHTANTIFVTNGLSHTVAREWKAYGRIQNKRIAFIRVHSYIVFLCACTQISMLYVSLDHYSVDIFVGALVATLMLSNDKVEYLTYFANPFLRKFEFPSTPRMEAYRQHWNATEKRTYEEDAPKYTRAKDTNQIVNKTETNTDDDAPVHLEISDPDAAPEPTVAT